jgi:hypothetical protein
VLLDRGFHACVTLSLGSQLREGAKKSPVVEMPSPARIIHPTRELEELRTQLRDEQQKHQQAKQALLAEQQHFSQNLAEIERMTKGARTPWLYRPIRQIIS